MIDSDGHTLYFTYPETIGEFSGEDYGGFSGENPAAMEEAQKEMDYAECLELAAQIVDRLGAGKALHLLGDAIGNAEKAQGRLFR